jgi:hypothetical protein
MDSNKPISDAERSELLALYQVTTQDLAFFKSQQWSLTNYGLLALAAIVGIPQVSNLEITSCIAISLSVIAVSVTLLTGFLLWRLHGSIKERRDRLKRVYARLSDEFRKARGEKKSVRPWEMLLPMLVVLALALVLSVWVIANGV